MVLSLCFWFIHSFLCSFYAYFVYDGEFYRKGGEMYLRMGIPWPVEPSGEYALSSLVRKINLSVICPCCLFHRFDLHVSGCAAVCHCYCCVSLLWVSSNMSGRGDKVTMRRFRNFAICVTYVRCLHFLSARLSGRWRLILMVFNIILASCHPSGACSSETASRYLENLWTSDLSDLSSLNVFSIIYSFSVQLFDKTHQFAQ